MPQSAPNHRLEEREEPAVQQQSSRLPSNRTGFRALCLISDRQEAYADLHPRAGLTRPIRRRIQLLVPVPGALPTPRGERRA